jgi:predicted glycosyltransferase involved in capsule biosynthesis
MNCGAVAAPKSSYYLFHDVDCLVQTTFFNNLLENLSRSTRGATQTFFGRRLLYLNDLATILAFDKKLDIDDLDKDTPGILTGKPGAPGGSIIVDRDTFIKVGGYDDELFVGYSPEDRFFWNKLELFTQVGSAENPPIEMFHMHHPPMHRTNPHREKLAVIWSTFSSLSADQKLSYIHLKCQKMTSAFVT